MRPCRSAAPSPLHWASADGGFPDPRVSRLRRSGYPGRTTAPPPRGAGRGRVTAFVPAYVCTVTVNTCVLEGSVRTGCESAEAACDLGDSRWQGAGPSRGRALWSSGLGHPGGAGEARLRKAGLQTPPGHAVREARGMGPHSSVRELSGGGARGALTEEGRWIWGFLWRGSVGLGLRGGLSCPLRSQAGLVRLAHLWLGLVPALHHAWDLICEDDGVTTCGGQCQ